MPQYKCPECGARVTGDFSMLEHEKNCGKQPIPAWLREEAEQFWIDIEDFVVAYVRGEAGFDVGCIAAFALRVGERLAQERKPECTRSHVKSVTARCPSCGTFVDDIEWE